jgi:hypothetical protein
MMIFSTKVMPMKYEAMLFPKITPMRHAMLEDNYSNKAMER